MIGGFVKFVLSKGWLCIRLHCSISICFKFLTAGWYVVTKGNKRSWPFGFCVCLYADCQEAKLTSRQTPFYDVFWVPSCFEALFEFQTTHFKCFFRRVSSGRSYFLPLINHILRLVGARGEVRNLESLGLPLMSFDVPDGIFGESFPIEHRGIYKSNLIDSLIFQPWIW